MHRPALRAERHTRHTVGHVAGVERLILLLAGEQRRLAGVGGSGSILVQRIGHLRQNESLVGIEGSAQCTYSRLFSGQVPVTFSASSKLLRSTLLKVSGPPDTGYCP